MQIAPSRAPGRRASTVSSSQTATNEVCARSRRSARRKNKKAQRGPTDRPLAGQDNEQEDVYVQTKKAAQNHQADNNAGARERARVLASPTLLGCKPVRSQIRPKCKHARRDWDAADRPVQPSWRRSARCCGAGCGLRPPRRGGRERSCGRRSGVRGQLHATFETSRARCRCSRRSLFFGRRRRGREEEDAYIFPSARFSLRCEAAARKRREPLRDVRDHGLVGGGGGGSPRTTRRL